MAVYSEDPNVNVDIGKWFDMVLVLFFCGSILNIAAEVVRVIGLWMISGILYLGTFVSFAGFIMLHVFRFSNAGKFCSGDYTTNKDWDAPLWSKGNFLLGFMIFLWSSSGFIFASCLILNYSDLG